MEALAPCSPFPTHIKKEKEQHRVSWAWCKSAFGAVRGAGGERGQCREFLLLCTALEGVWEAVNQQIRKSNKALAVIRRGR